MSTAVCKAFKRVMQNRRDGQAGTYGGNHDGNKACRLVVNRYFTTRSTTFHHKDVGSYEGICKIDPYIRIYEPHLTHQNPAHTKYPFLVDCKESSANAYALHE